MFARRERTGTHVEVIRVADSYPFKRKFGPIRSSRTFCDDLKLLRRLIQGFYKLQITFNHHRSLYENDFYSHLEDLKKKEEEEEELRSWKNHPIGNSISATLSA